MLEIFTTREIALGICLSVIVIFILSQKEIREKLFEVIKCVFCKEFVKIYIFLIVYMIILIKSFQGLPFWENIFIKDIVFWVLFVGTAACIKAGDKNLEENYFRNMVVDNIKIATIIEFSINLFNFSIFLEIIIQAIMIALSVLRAVNEANEKNKVVKKFFDVIFYLTIIVILIFTIEKAINSINDIDLIETIIAFFIPIICSIAYMPVAYSIGIYSRYQSLFFKISNPRDENVEKNRKRKMKVFLTCGLSYKSICKFEKQFCGYATNILQRYDDKIFYKFVEVFKEKG